MRSPFSIAAHARATALSMSKSELGSGRSRFSVGLRTSPTSPVLTPREVSSSPSVSEMPVARANSRTASSSAFCRIHFRPEKERATPNAAVASRPIALADILAAVARLDPAHGSGCGAHDHALRRHKIASDFHALEHRAVGHAGGGKHHISGGQVHQRVFAVEIGDAELGGAGAFVIFFEHQPRLDLSADA